MNTLIDKGTEVSQCCGGGLKERRGFGGLTNNLTLLYLTLIILLQLWGRDYEVKLMLTR